MQNHLKDLSPFDFLEFIEEMAPTSKLISDHAIDEIVDYCMDNKELIHLSYSENEDDSRLELFLLSFGWDSEDGKFYQLGSDKAGHLSLYSLLAELEKPNSNNQN